MVLSNPAWRIPLDSARMSYLAFEVLAIKYTEVVWLKLHVYGSEAEKIIAWADACN